MKAFVFDPLWDELITTDLQKKLDESGLEVIVTKEVAPLADTAALFEGDEDRILCINPDYVGWKLSSDDYKDIPGLKAILVASTGFEYVDQAAANEKGIAICNIRHFNNESVAEWAIMMMFNLARQTPRLIKDGFPLDFDKDFMKYRGIELKGKTVGVIGLGHIGAAIAERAAGLGMNVVYWDRQRKPVDYTYASLEELFSEVDIIFPALAKNPETLALITKDHIDSLKPSAIVVDVVHGLFEHDDLIQKVSDGQLFGFGFEGDPKSFAHYEGNIWAAPAYAWATDQSMQNSMTKWIQNMVDANNGEYSQRVN
jgi:glycerate dehydrogenase